MNEVEQDRQEYESAAEKIRPEFLDYLADHEGEHLDLEELARRFRITEETAQQWTFDRDHSSGSWEE